MNYDEINAAAGMNMPDPLIVCQDALMTKGQNQENRIGLYCYHNLHAIGPVLKGNAMTRPVIGALVQAMILCTLPFPQLPILHDPTSSGFIIDHNGGGSHGTLPTSYRAERLLRVTPFHIIHWSMLDFHFFQGQALGQTRWSQPAASYFVAGAPDLFSFSTIFIHVFASSPSSV
jgi:hypothetical protein